MPEVKAIYKRTQANTFRELIEWYVDSCKQMGSSMRPK